MSDLTVSNIERQNVLNNNYALQAIQENVDVNGLLLALARGVQIFPPAKVQHRVLGAEDKEQCYP